MADKYEKWNKYAPQMIADLIHDFGFTDWQAASFVGNAAAESSYFNDIIEDGAKGAGGTGWFQWTGMNSRRGAFERWIRRKGWAADSYFGNYSFLFRELKGIEGTESRIVDRVKNAATLEQATERVCAEFERPAKNNYAPRIKGAWEALELYRKNPPSPTVWPTDTVKEPTVPVTPTPTPVPPLPGGVPTVVPPSDPPAIPLTRSNVILTALFTFGTGLAGILAFYKPGVPLSEQWQTIVIPALTILGSTCTVLARAFSSVQPVTLNQSNADAIIKQRQQEAAVAVQTTRAGGVAEGVAQQVATQAQAPAPVTSRGVDTRISDITPEMVLERILKTGVGFATGGPVGAGLSLLDLPLKQLIGELPEVMQAIRGINQATAMPGVTTPSHDPARDTERRGGV